jgi:glutamine cyclotransferase
LGRKRQAKGTQKRAAEPAKSTVRSPSRVWVVAVVAVIALAGVWALRSGSTSQASPANESSSLTTASAAESQPVVRSLRVEVLREFSHERDAYTQGLVWWDDHLFESTGRVGESTLRRLDPRTGRVEQRIDVPYEYFGEGLALIDRRLIMLTWRAQRAFTYDRDTFEVGQTFQYQGEGWGLCHDGSRLVMSDGSDLLVFRDPVTFEPIGEQRVRLRGQPLRRLNELECVDGAVYANVWEEDYLVRIDPETGRVTDYIDATGLLEGEDLVGAEVLNGIAYDPTAETFYITGKWWPKMFEVRFIE